jgi:ligand-binding sensor domain-containing protein/DNA-binding CsgD family transcriptional regulator
MSSRRTYLCLKQLCFCISLTCCLSSLPTFAQSEKLSGLPFIRNFTSQDFKGGIQSWAITQDKRDFIYVANNFGLLEYDGNEWSHYSVKNGTKIRSVYINEDNIIHVGAQGDFGFFSTDSRGNLNYVSLADSLPKAEKNFSEVWRIFKQGPDIYFLTFENIYRYDGHKVMTIVPDSPLEFSFLVNQKLYIQAWGKGICELKNDRLQTISGGDYFKYIRIASILPYHYAGLLIITNNQGIYTLENGSVKPFRVQPRNLFDNSLINTALLLKEGSIAIGTANNGLIILDEAGNLERHISKKDGLLDRSVLNIYQDTQDNVWLALNNGIALIELSSPFTVIDEKMGLPGAGYAAYKKDNEVLLGTNNGLFSLNTESRQITQIPNSTGQVYSIGKIGEDYLIGHHNGPMLLKNGSLTTFYDEKGAWLFKAFPGKENYFLEGTYNGINVFERNGENFRFIKKLEQLNESSRVIEFDNEGNIWMAHGYKGIFKLQATAESNQASKIRFYNSRNGFPADILINMERINNELIFPAQTGIYRYDKVRDIFVLDERFSKIFNLQEHIIDMEQDIMGNIYFISNQRIGLLQLKQFGQYTLKTDIFYRILDLINDDLTSIHVLNPKNILFGAKEGFVHYNAQSLKSTIPFKVHIRRARVSTTSDSTIFGGNMNQAIAEPIIPYTENSLRFNYSATFFENPEKTVFQYYLKGFDQNWSDWTVKAEKEYTNLPEGTYVFQVKARNIYGTESEATSYSFKISPPWYRSSWAYFVYVISLCSIMGFVFYKLDKRYKKERQLILLKKQQEITQKETEMKKLSDKSEQEIVRLKNEKLVSEIDHMNKELTSSTIHLINKNEQLSSVKQSLLELLNQKPETSKEEIKHIVNSIDKSISSDEDWHRFEMNFNLVHGDFIKRLLQKYASLTPQEIKLSAYLRLNLNTKEIAQLMNISNRGVEISRYRLRKKLNLDREENLTEFMLKF